MDLLALAVPFFLLALVAELALDRWRGTGHYRLNDAISSLSTGALNTTFGYFTRLLQITIWGLVLQHFALFEIDPALFDLSPRGLALWALAIIAFDFCYYWAHRLGHEVSILWAAHAVHHQSEDYNLSTALRQTASGFLFNWVFYLPLFLLGLPLEVVVTANAIDLIYQFWVHTQHVGRLGWLDRVFVTPSNHRVHHAQNRAYIDRNYGGILILWDRLFGTFQEELDEEPVVFGVRKPLANWNPFWANLQVYDYLWFDACRTKRWQDKLGIWFRRTGWRPADVEARYPKQCRRTDRFEKYDPPLAAPLRFYLLLQFAVAIALVFTASARYVSGGAGAAVLPCLALWSTLYAIGLLNDGRRNALRIERIRLLLITPLLAVAVLWDGGSTAVTAWVALTTAYIVLSIGALQFVQRAIPEPDAPHAAH